MRISRWRPLPLLLCAVWLLAFPRIGTAQRASAAEPTSEGFYRVQLSSRSFDAPLFGDAAAGRAYLLLGQRLPRLGMLSFWFERGLPTFTTDFGAEWRDLPLLGGLARINGGDFLLQPLRPPRTAVTTFAARDIYPLQGLRFQQAGARSQWSVFAGRAKRFRPLPERPADESVLFGVQYLRRFRTNFVGFSFTGIDAPTFLDERDETLLAGVLSGSYFREISPWMGVMAEVHTSLQPGFGARVGSQFRFQSGELSALLYRYDAHFPFVFPLYRPGESGAIVSGQYLLSEFTALFGYLDYVLASEVDERADFRAEVGMSRSLGSNRPHLYLSYAHNQIDFDETRSELRRRRVDLLALSLTQNTAAMLTSLRLEHLFQGERGTPDQSRAHLLFRRLSGNRAYWNASLDAVRDVGGSYRVIGEASVERPLWGRFRYVLGLGATLRDNGVRTTGEGLLRVGLSRRVARNGLSVRLEIARPFSIGLPRSQVPGLRLALDLGHRAAWDDLASLRSSLLPAFRSRRLGGIEGRILFAGRGVSRVTVYVNGEARAVTDGRGRYRVRGVPPGRVAVRLDIREFETRYGVVGGPARQVVVVAGEVTQADFELAEMSYLQGSIIRCEGDAVRPLADATLMLEGEGYRRQVQTSRVGGFQFDEIPPGPYELVYVPEGQAARRWQIDLAQDVAGYLIRLDCADE